MSSYWGVNRNIDVTKSSRLALIFEKKDHRETRKMLVWVVEAFLFFIHSVSAIHWKSGCVVLTTAKASVRHRGWRYNSFLYLLIIKDALSCPFRLPGPWQSLRVRLGRVNRRETVIHCYKRQFYCTVVSATKNVLQETLINLRQSLK